MGRRKAPSSSKVEEEQQYIEFTCKICKCAYMTHSIGQDWVHPDRNCKECNGSGYICENLMHNESFIKNGISFENS